ncbi:MAG: FAD-binding oxidoreductase [Solirubrobacterales bacterium]
MADWSRKTGMAATDSRSRPDEEMLIIGGGLQGVTAALALAARGIRSRILESRSQLLRGASYRNEGKVHLGFVYALDESGVTARKMVEGALTFSDLIEGWCGEVDWQANCSEGFDYCVVDSGLADAAALGRHYEEVVSIVEAASGALGDNYLGSSARVEPVRHRGSHALLAPGLSGDWFSTPERSVDPRALCDWLLAAAAANPLVEVQTGVVVKGVVPIASGFALEIGSGAGSGKIEAETVLNCSWENRLELDRQALGKVPSASYRIKHQVLARGEAEVDLAPLTLVQGPYGDIVPWPNGDVYVSWYPVARTFIGSSPSAGTEPDRDVAEATLEGLAAIVPGLQGLEVVDYGAAWIIGEGEADIDETSSGLHARRATEINRQGGWWSLNGGKLTTAPLTSELCVAELTGTEPQIGLRV